MEGFYENATKALDQLEALCSGRAYPGARACVQKLERDLEQYIERDGQLRPCLVSSEVLWREFGRLKAAVESQNPDAVLTASSDLRAQLVAFERSRQAA